MIGFIIVGVIFLFIFLLVIMTRNNGQHLEKMADIFDSDIFEDITCFNKCIETCLAERVPELTKDFKVSCEQECGMICADNTPTFRF